MLYCGHESLLPRFTTARPPSSRCRTDASGDRQDLRGLGGDDQALSQTTPRNGSCAAQNDPRSACQERSGVAGPLESAVRSPSRCDTRRTLPAVPSRPWHRGEHSQHQSRQSGPGLDAKKKTLVAREQDQEARRAWREQAPQLASQDLVFVDETGTHIAMTPVYTYAPRGQRAYGQVPRNSGANTTLMASLSRQGMGEALILEGAADAVAFELYIEQILAPSLRPGQIVIMDKLSVSIRAHGCGRPSKPQAVSCSFCRPTRPISRRLKKRSPS